MTTFAYSSCSASGTFFRIAKACCTDGCETEECFLACRRSIFGQNGSNSATGSGDEVEDIGVGESLSAKDFFLAALDWTFFSSYRSGRSKLLLITDGEEESAESQSE